MDDDRIIVESPPVPAAGDYWRTGLTVPPRPTALELRAYTS